MEYKQSVSKFVPVRIVDTTGTPVAGVAFGAVTATVMKADGTTQAVTIAAPDWSEINTGAFATTGMYILRLSAANVDQPGLLSYAVAVAGNTPYVGAIKVVANEEVDTYTAVGVLRKYEEGRWKIHVTGADANRLVLYDTDDVTPLLKFDLKDNGGVATFVNPFERVPA